MVPDVLIIIIGRSLMDVVFRDLKLAVHPQLKIRFVKNLIFFDVAE